MTAKAKDAFEKAPEILAAFDNIRKNGHFGQLNFMIRTYDSGKVHSCNFEAIGYLPNDEKYQSSGCGVITNPRTVIANCRELAKQNEVENFTGKVTTEDWPLWNKSGNDVVGSRGQKVTLSFYIEFAKK